MGPLGVQEMIVIFLVALVLFGPKKLPELGKTIAKAMSEFRRAQSDLKATFDREMRSLEQENESLKEATRQAAIDIGNYSDIDITGGGSTSGAEPNPVNAATDWHGVESGAPTTVSASEIPSAESHGSVSEAIGHETVERSSDVEASPPVVQAAGDIVARGAVIPTTGTSVVMESPAATQVHGDASPQDPSHGTQNT